LLKRNGRKVPGIIALSLIVSILMVMMSGLAAASGVSVVTNTPEGESIHEKIDISEITGEIAEPPQLTSAASALAAQKEWYEYVYYSPEAVAHFYITDTTRLTFFDPYDYATALVMEVDDSITDWSSMNTLQVSYTTGNSMSDTVGKSSETSTFVQNGYTDTTTTTEGENTVTTTVNNRTDSYNTSKTVTKEEDNTTTWGLNENAETGLTQTVNISAGIEKVAEIGGSVSTSISGSVGASQSWVTGEKITTTEIESTEENEEFKGRTGYTKSEDTTTVKTGEQVTTIENIIADRTTQVTGYNTNSCVTLETNNSTTVTKTYDAAYFNAGGSPLQWKIIQYTVKMPMKYQVEYLVDGEWIFGDYNYCLLNTIQGTCRAWLQNNVAYYEHWGTGEAVTWNEFWSQFFTEESLIQAYQNKLYPD